MRNSPGQLSTALPPQWIHSFLLHSYLIPSSFLLHSYLIPTSSPPPSSLFARARAHFKPQNQNTSKNNAILNHSVLVHACTQARAHIHTCTYTATHTFPQTRKYTTSPTCMRAEVQIQPRRYIGNKERVQVRIIPIFDCLMKT